MGASSPFLFMPPKPHLGLHTPSSSSYTRFLLCSLVLGAMPFLAANFCHFVRGLGVGSGFSRGSGVVGGGSVRETPSWLEVMGQVVKSWLIRAWAPSRAVSA